MTTATITVIERAKVEAINREHRAAEDARRAWWEHAVECGRMLAAVKADLAHGEWGPWLAEHFEASADYSEMYRKVATEYEKNPELVRNFTGPRDARMQLVEKPRRASPRDAIGMVSALADDDESSAITARLDEAHDRLRESVEIWSSSQLRDQRRIVELRDAMTVKLDNAFADAMSPAGIADLLRDAAILNRRLGPLLEDLAFTFER